MPAQGGRGGHGMLWTTNQFLAHKKNIGEEARLLGDLDLIHRRMILSTSGLDVQLRRLHSDLQDVRSSTGYSKEAIPSSPLQQHRQHERGHKTSSQAKFHAPSLTNTSNTPVVGPHLSAAWRKGQKNVPQQRHGVNESKKKKTARLSDISLTPLHPSATGSRKWALFSKHLLTLSEGNTDRNGEDMLTPEIAERCVSFRFTNWSTNLPAIKQNHGAITRENTSLQNVDSGQTLDLKSKPSSQPLLLKHVCKDNTTVAMPRDTSETEISKSFPSITPLARKITDILKAVIQKNDKPQVTEKTGMFISNKTKLGPTNFHKPSVPKSRNQTAKLPDSQYDCLTSARPRDNRHFHRFLNEDTKCSASLEHKQLPVSQESNHRLGKSYEDLDKTKTVKRSQNRSSAKWVDNDEELAASKTRSADVKRYSGRSRLSQLAEPKGGRKAPLHISCRALRRQAQALRHPHPQPYLSQRQQERLLGLQSRVRLFMAVLQDRQLPSGMVHIPQRDDIMNVDISHIG